MDWQSITSAPKDRWILLCNKDEPDWAGNMWVAKWFGEGEHACFWTSGGPNGGMDLMWTFTHWADVKPPQS